MSEPMDAETEARVHKILDGLIVRSAALVERAAALDEKVSRIGKKHEERLDGMAVKIRELRERINRV